MNAFYIVSGLSVLVMVAEVAGLKKGLVALVFAGLATALAFASMAWGTSLSYYSDMMRFDNFALAFSMLIITTAMFWLVMASGYLKGSEHKVDRIALVLFAVAGGVTMVSFNSLVMLFIGIEILSISLYALAGSNKERLSSNEASFKYFLMGSFATGFLLLGIALVYGATGSFALPAIATFLSGGADVPNFFFAGVLLMLVGIGFKIAAVPFHFWTPDVYEGSPTVVTAFMATVAKTAAIGAFYKVFNTFVAVQSNWAPLAIGMVVLTLGVANITAVFQVRVKRMLAYSSVAQAGYLLLAFVVAPASSGGTIFYYLAGYCASSLAAFAVLVKLGDQETLGGLASRSRLLAAVLTVSLLSLAGIPPLAGFFGKYLVLLAALNAGFPALTVFAVITSLIGVYYYLRVLVPVYGSASGPAIEVTPLEQIFLVLLIFVMVALGIFPEILVLLIT